MQAIVSKEVIATTDAPEKESNMLGVWRIGDLYKFTSAYNIMQSRKWMENIALAAEALIVLDFVDEVVQNMKGAEEGKIAINMDCGKVWEHLLADPYANSLIMLY